MALKKIVPHSVLRATLLALLCLGLTLLAACVQPIPVDVSSSESESLLPAEVSSVSVTLPDAEPVSLNAEDSSAVLSMLEAAQETDEHVVASLYMATITVENADDSTREYLVYEGEQGGLVLAMSGGRVATADPAAFYEVISGEAFFDLYVADAPVTLFCGETDYTDGVSVTGELLKTMPNGIARRNTVSVTGAEHPVLVDSLNQKLSLTFEVQPTEVTVVMTDEDGNALYQGDLPGLNSYLPSKNRTCTVEVIAAWKDQGRTGFDGSCTYRFAVTYDLPVIVQSAQVNVVQGQPILIYIRNAQELEVTATGIKYDPFYLRKDDLRVLIYPTHYNTPSGNGVISVITEAGTQDIPFSIQKYDFDTQYLTISSELSEGTVNNDTANYVYTITAQSINEIVDEGRIYFTSAFMQPVEGEITTEFGMKRYVNGVAQSVHAGIDIAADAGTPVAASNAGRVVFADELQLTGNTVVIEHGSGIKTWYYHMESLNVSEGQMVEKGETIGFVGSTGFSTGPHLHFAVTVDGIYISPWYVIDTTLFDQNYRENVLAWPEEEPGEESEDSEDSEASDDSSSSEDSEASDDSSSSADSESAGE